MKTKSELYDYLHAFGQKIFINSDNEYLLEMATKSGVNISGKLIKYSFHNTDNLIFTVGEVISCSPFLNLRCKTIRAEFEVQSNLVGVYNAENMLAAVTIGSFFDVPESLIKLGLESYIPQNNRSQLTVSSKNKLVVDAYNANPTSMLAAIMNFVQMNVSSKMLILGDMLELGETSKEEHQRIINVLEKYQFKQVWLVGGYFEATNNSFEVFMNVDEVVQRIKNEDIRDCYILIKGSRGIKLEKIIPYL